MTTRTLLARGEAIRSTIVRRASTDLVLNSATWTVLDATLDLVLTAESGDKIEVGMIGLWGSEFSNSQLDIATIISGSPVTYASSGTGTQAGNGVVGWFGLSGVASNLGGSVLFTLGGGDISGGQVTLRILYQNTAATNKTLFANSTNTLAFWAKNLGPG